MTGTDVLQSIKLNVVIYRDDEEWVARCLQIDMAARDKTREGVERDILGMIMDKVESAIKVDRLSEVFVSAPAEEWKRLEGASLCDIKKIDITAGMEPDCAIRSRVRDVEICFV